MGVVGWCCVCFASGCSVGGDADGEWKVEVIGVPQGIITTVARADFRGEIKRIRIRKKRVGSGFKVTSQLTNNYAHRAAKAEFVLTQEGSEKPQSVSLEVSQRKDGMQVVELEADFTTPRTSSGDILAINIYSSDGKLIATKTKNVSASAVKEDVKVIENTLEKEVKVVENTLEEAEVVAKTAGNGKGTRKGVKLPMNSVLDLL